MGRIASVRPLWAIEGGRVTLEGDGFPVDENAPLPQVRLCSQPARIAAASSSSITLIVPPGVEGGSVAVRVDELPGETAFVEVGAPLVTGVHHVDSPAYDRHGNLFVTFSGSRGQQVPVSIYMVRRDGSREPFVVDLPNPTSLAFDRSGQLHVSSRFDGSVYRISPEGAATAVASDLGVACGIAFDEENVLFVGDRSGTILRVQDGRASPVASLPPSVAAFHLAFGPDQHLYVTGPTLGTRDSIYRIDRSGDVSIFYEGLGRPQGLAFDEDGRLYVADALAGTGGIFRFARDGGQPECMVAAGGLVGLAFGPRGSLAVCSADTVYRLDVGVRGLLPFTRQ